VLIAVPKTKQRRRISVRATEFGATGAKAFLNERADTSKTVYCKDRALACYAKQAGTGAVDSRFYRPQNGLK
jgi:hypothetical protein